MLNIRSVHFTSRVTFARLHNLMTCMHDVNNCLQFVFVMSISDQTVSSKPVIFDRKIVLGQNTIHKDCISNNKVRFSAESKYPLASILCCHVWGLTVVWYIENNTWQNPYHPEKPISSKGVASIEATEAIASVKKIKNKNNG